MDKRMKNIFNRINYYTMFKKPKKDNESKSTITVQEMVKKMRLLNENDVNRKNLKTVYDQAKEEEKFKNQFKDLNVIIDFIPLEVYDDLVFWGGTIDGVIQFVYKVTPNENTSGIEFNYLDDFDVNNPDNEEIVKRIKDYYDDFYKYWRDNIFNK